LQGGALAGGSRSIKASRPITGQNAAVSLLAEVGQHRLDSVFALQEPALRIEVVEQQRQLHEGQGSRGPTDGPLLQQLTRVSGCHQS